MEQETVVKILQWIIAAFSGIVIGFFVGRGERVDRQAVYREAYDAGISTGKAQALAEQLHKDLEKLNKGDTNTSLQRQLASAVEGDVTGTNLQAVGTAATTATLDSTKQTVDCSTYPFDSPDRARCVADNSRISQSTYQAIANDCADRSNNHVYTEQCVNQGVSNAERGPQVYVYQQRRPAYRLPRNP